MQGPPEVTETMDRKLAQLRELAAARDLNRLENVWMDVVEDSQGAASRLDDLVALAADLSPALPADRLGPLLELLMPCVTEATPARAALKLHELLLRAFPEKKDYRAAFCERFERLHPVASAERAYYEASGIASGAATSASIERLGRLLRFREGAYVFHRSGWGAGRVLAVDPFLRQVKVDLEKKRDHRIAIDAIDSILEPLTDDSFVALRLDRVSELKRLKDDDPVRLIHLVLDAFGNPLPLKELKAPLVPDVIAGDAWSRWWSRAKTLLREAGIFRVGDRAPHAVERLEQAVSYEQEMIARFRKAEWPEARQIARQAARRSGNELPAAWAVIRDRLIALSETGERGQSIEAALILSRAEEDVAGFEALKKAFGRLSEKDLAGALQDLTVADDQRRAVESLPRTRTDDWQAVAIRLLFGKKDAVREAAWDVLEREAPEKALATIQDLVKSPRSSPDAFAYILQAHLAGSARPSLDPLRGKGPREVLVLILDLFDHLQHRAQREGRVALKETVGRVQDLLTGDDGKVFRDGLIAMESSERSDVHSRLVKNENVTVFAKGALLDVLNEIEPDIVQAFGVPIWEEDAIYVTEEGLARKKEEFRDLMEVKLPKNFQDIGRAAAFGDLSENAEYTAALEERDHLTKRATKMKAELDKAKVIGSAMVKDGIAGLGSRIRLRNLSTGDETVYSLLGPWDGGPEDGVLSYLSPLGRTFVGKKAGETVEAQLPGGVEKYELVETGSYFDAGA